VRVKNARNTNEFEAIHLQTGICKPTVLSGLVHRLKIPKPFNPDIMHVTTLNASELMLALYCGKMKVSAGDSKRSWDWAVLKNAIWTNHGAAGVFRSGPVRFFMPKLGNLQLQLVFFNLKYWQLQLQLF
jgi:hypothetical protein